MIDRAIAGLLVAALIAAAAWRARALSTSGAAAATVVGAITVAAGWAWGVLLIAFFVASTALSHWRAGIKAARTGAIVAKGGARDAWQVLANGGVFAAAALLSLAAPSSAWRLLGAGALAAAAADTWGTEVGTLAAGPPRLITTWRRVPAGTSGAVSPVGIAASVAGALFVAAVALLAGWPPRAAAAALAGGVAGALADSLLGARWQARRRCPACDAGTERDIHGCGTPTERAGGVAWLDNDVVNVLSGVVGGAVGVLIGLA
ncbi:MAG TPA: DUF92 domain-containing protein [Gemmatimonadaceae bacterium]